MHSYLNPSLYAILRIYISILFTMDNEFFCVCTTSFFRYLIFIHLRVYQARYASSTLDTPSD